MHLDPPGSTDAVRWGKRLFDIVGSLGLLLALSPIFLLRLSGSRPTTVVPSSSARREWDGAATSSSA